MTLDGVRDHILGVVGKNLLYYYFNLINNPGVILCIQTTYELMKFWLTLLENP